ncbi:MAG: phosphatase PAP2 family protein [Propionivibrio sp.]
MSHPAQLPDRLLSVEGVNRAFIALLVSASLILIINQYTDLDLLLADLYFDQGTHSFPWRNSWFANAFMHGWIKYAIIAFGLMLLAVAVVDIVRPWRKLTPLSRLQLRSVVLTMILAPLAVAVLKQGSNVHCPWSLTRYGGAEPLLRLLDWVPPHWDAGRCFPAGQTSTGTWLAALAVFWLPHDPRRAFKVFLGGMGVGLALGWVQQMRGAHFLTHTLATLWVTGAVLLAVLVVMPRLRRMAGGSLRPRVTS